MNVTGHGDEGRKLHKEGCPQKIPVEQMEIGEVWDLHAKKYILESLETLQRNHVQVQDVYDRTCASDGSYIVHYSLKTEGRKIVESFRIRIQIRGLDWVISQINNFEKYIDPHLDVENWDVLCIVILSYSQQEPYLAYIIPRRNIKRSDGKYKLHDDNGNIFHTKEGKIRLEGFSLAKEFFDTNFKESWQYIDVTGRYYKPDAGLTDVWDIRARRYIFKSLRKKRIHNIFLNSYISDESWHIEHYSAKKDTEKFRIRMQVRGLDWVMSQINNIEKYIDPHLDDKSWDVLCIVILSYSQQEPYLAYIIPRRNIKRSEGKYKLHDDNGNIFHTKEGKIRLEGFSLAKEFFDTNFKESWQYIDIAGKYYKEPVILVKKL